MFYFGFLCCFSVFLQWKAPFVPAIFSWTWTSVVYSINSCLFRFFLSSMRIWVCCVYGVDARLFERKKMWQFRFLDFIFVKFYFCNGNIELFSFDSTGQRVRELNVTTSVFARQKKRIFSSVYMHTGYISSLICLAVYK